MERYFTVTVWYPDNSISVFPHVSVERLSFGAQTNYCSFVDKDGKRHIFMGFTVVADEESSKDVPL